MLLQRYRMSLARIREYMVVNVRRQIRTGIRNWTQIRDSPHLRRGDCTTCYPRCVGHAVADVDGIWDYVGIRGRFDILSG